MLIINVCTVCFFMDAMASVKLDNKSLFNKKKKTIRHNLRFIQRFKGKNKQCTEGCMGGQATLEFH